MGLWGWDADIVEWGMGSLVAAHGLSNAGAGWQGAGQGARGGGSIVASKLSGGATDRLKITASSQYQGAEYDASRALSDASDKLLMASGVGAGIKAAGVKATAIAMARMVAVNEAQQVAGDVAVSAGADPETVERIKAAAQLATIALSGKGKNPEGKVGAVEDELEGNGSKYSNLPDPKNVGPGKDFTRATKRKIYEQNKAENEGEIRSDKSGEAAVPSQQSESGVTPPENEAQIDHITPKSKGGSNSPSNAQVLTRKENREKSDD
jgi:hypothetical protein